MSGIGGGNVGDSAQNDPEHVWCGVRMSGRERDGRKGGEGGRGLVLLGRVTYLNVLFGVGGGG